MSLISKFVKLFFITHIICVYDTQHLNIEFIMKTPWSCLNSRAHIFNQKKVKKKKSFSCCLLADFWLKLMKSCSLKSTSDCRSHNFYIQITHIRRMVSRPGRNSDKGGIGQLLFIFYFYIC